MILKLNKNLSIVVGTRAILTLKKEISCSSNLYVTKFQLCITETTSISVGSGP